MGRPYAIWAHMGLPYAYGASQKPILVWDIPYAYGPSHTCIGQNMHMGCNISSIVVFSLISQSFSQDFMKFLCVTLEHHYCGITFPYKEKTLKLDESTSCLLLQLFRYDE